MRRPLAPPGARFKRGSPTIQRGPQPCRPGPMNGVWFVVLRGGQPSAREFRHRICPLCLGAVLSVAALPQRPARLSGLIPWRTSASRCLRPPVPARRNAVTMLRGDSDEPGCTVGGSWVLRAELITAAELQSIRLRHKIQVCERLFAEVRRLIDRRT